MATIYLLVHGFWICGVEANRNYWIRRHVTPPASQLSCYRFWT